MRNKSSNKSTVFLSLLYLFCWQAGTAQFYNLPSDYNFALLTEKQLAKKDSSIHCGIKPYIFFYSKKYEQVIDSTPLFKYITNDPAIDLVFNKHFLRVNVPKEKFTLHIDPLFNIESGRDLADSVTSTLYTNTRGIIAAGTIGEKFYFETFFSENQSVFPQYISNAAKATGVVPGQGRWKAFKTQGFDYAFSSGFISMQLFKNVNLQVGHGKQKVGNGYRSLLLSDNSFNYPFLRLTQQWFKGRLQYTNIYAVLMNLVPASSYINPNTERLFQKKAASFQHLSLNLNKSINVGLFQGLIWQAADNKNRQHLDWQYYNPVIFTNLLNYGLNNKNNLLIGADLNVKLTNKVSLYGQLMVDHLRPNLLYSAALGYQGGIKYFDFLRIKNLFLQFECNVVAENSYSSPSSTTAGDQGYSHYNQNLAYTPVSGTEFIFMADYKYKRFFTNVRYHQQWHPVRVVDDYVVNIASGRVGYLINPAYNLNISLGILYRTQNFYNFNASNNVTNYINLSIKTSLYNLYYDF